jgi:hypothetical protein
MGSFGRMARPDVARRWLHGADETLAFAGGFMARSEFVESVALEWRSLLKTDLVLVSQVCKP